jgi:uncharacterized membrane protein YraQ (UPF0718 family)
MPSPAVLDTLAVVFISIVLEAIPFMLIGALAGGMIEAFVSRDRMASLLPRSGWRAVCLMAGAGILFPVCECAVVPVARRLIGKGLPVPAAIAYLLAGPIVNPVTAASTALAYAFDWRVAALRLAAGYGIAVSAALAMGRFFPGGSAVGGTACGCGHACAREAGPGDWVDKTGHAVLHAADDVFAVGPWLVIGAFLAASAQTFVPRSLFLGMNASPALSSALMMALAILLNLCSEADAFVAASLRNLVPPHAQMAFLLTGPMLDLKLLLMYRSVFRRGAIAALAAVVLSAVFAVSTGLAFLAGTAP